VRADGTFEVWGVPGRDVARLEVCAPDHLRKSIDTPLPGPDLDIVLHVEGECRITATLDPRISELGYVRDVLLAEFVAANGERIRRAGELEGQRWTCEARVPAGTHRLELTTRFCPSPVAAAERVVVPARAASAPLTFDLRQTTRVCRLTWVDAANQPLEVDSALVCSTSATSVRDGERCMRAVYGEASGITLLGLGDALDLIVESDLLIGRYVGPFADAQVRLQAPPAVAFHVADLPPAPSGTSWSIRAIASSGGAAVKLLIDGEPYPCALGFVFGAVDAGGSGTIPLAPSSRYAFDLLLSAEDHRKRRTRVIAAISGEVDIGAQLPDSLTLRFDPEQLRAAVR
jgi:hypothetical protein